MKTKCSYCGIESNNQPAGDGCHSCLQGIMQPASGLYRIEFCRDEFTKLDFAFCAFILALVILTF